MKISDYLQRIQPTQGKQIKLDLTTHNTDITLQKLNELQKPIEKDRIKNSQASYNKWMARRIMSVTIKWIGHEGSYQKACKAWFF